MCVCTYVCVCVCVHLCVCVCVCASSSYGISLPSDIMNPGLVEFGTKCGTNMVCSGQQCMTVAAGLNPPTCPSGSNGLVCSGSSRGVSIVKVLFLIILNYIINYMNHFTHENYCNIP